MGGYPIAVLKLPATVLNLEPDMSRMGGYPIAVLKHPLTIIVVAVVAAPHRGIPYCGIEAFELNQGRKQHDLPHGWMPYCGIEAFQKGPLMPWITHAAWGDTLLWY